METPAVLALSYLCAQAPFPTSPKMETQVPAADIIRRKIEDHVAKEDLRAAVVQCEELEILVGLAKQGGWKRNFLVARSLERTELRARYELVLLVAPVKQYECNSRKSYGLS